MLRISRLLQAARGTGPLPKRPEGSGYVVIWNLTSRCNLACRHCYARENGDPEGHALSTAEARRIVEQLSHEPVYVLILSGGEPMLRSDLYELAAYAAGLGITCALSTNGTLIDEGAVCRIKESGLQYIGISIDGAPREHDAFRGRTGAFDASLRAIRLCRDAGLKVGLRFSLTAHTARQLAFVFDLFEREALVKLYVSHMNYATRGLRPLGLEPHRTRASMGFVIGKAMAYLRRGDGSREIVTGNNEADAPFLMLSVEREEPELAARLHPVLQRNRQAVFGERLINLDPWGKVHPDPFCKDLCLGDVRETPLHTILKSPRGLPGVGRGACSSGSLNGRCGQCRFMDLCGGNSRARAYAEKGDWQDSDPLCYLTDDEIACVPQAGNNF